MTKDMQNDLCFQKFAVGEKRECWQTKKDYLILEYSKISGLTLYVFLNRITSEEIENFSDEKKLHMKFIPFDAAGFLLWKFGELPVMDTPFSPNLYAGDANFSQIEDFSQGLPLNVLVIDSNSGTLVTIRIIGLGHDFSNDFLNWCREKKDSDFTKDQYEAFVNKIYKKYSPQDLWDIFG